MFNGFPRKFKTIAAPRVISLRSEPSKRKRASQADAKADK
jgi:hypothetical protein